MIKVPTTVQNRCKVVRSGGLAEKNRRLAEMLSENFPLPKYQGNCNYCCGRGGGAWGMPYSDERIYYGRVKAQQIRDTGAKLVIAPCHN
jgi:Fe-S oxidoreductase